MCQSNTDGGKRCGYADMVSNVRKKARYKLRDAGYNIEREVEKEVNKWKEKHPDVVTAHLPEKLSFQRPGKPVIIPDDIKALLSPKARIPIMGLEDNERAIDLQKRHQENLQWHESMSREEEYSVSAYTTINYTHVNAFLRRRGLSMIAKKGLSSTEELEAMAKRDVKNIDSALKKAPQREIGRVYRYHEVPAGVKPSEYLRRFFPHDGIYHEDGYMSTTVDPELVMAHMYSKNKGTVNKKYIVMEIVTAQGGSMQSDSKVRSGSIQSLESEVLLPRNSEFAIVDSRASQKFEFASDRREFSNFYGGLGTIKSDAGYQEHGKFKKGDVLNFPLVQLVDKKLL